MSKPWTAEQRAKFAATMKRKRDARALREAGTTRSKQGNVTLETDLIEALVAAGDRLRSKFGFQPTLSQTVRYLVNVKGKL